jgi:hypothetical protein
VLGVSFGVFFVYCALVLCVALGLGQHLCKKSDVTNFRNLLSKSHSKLVSSFFAFCLGSLDSDIFYLYTFLYIQCYIPFDLSIS